ncbi:MAG: exosortase H [Bacteroidota bacterium]
MGNSAKKRALKKKNEPSAFLKGVRSQWMQKRPVLLFVGAFAVLMILFYIGMITDFFQLGIQPHIVALNSSLSSFFLNLFGMKTTANKEIIASSSFSISVARGCDGVEAMALFATALLAFPAKWKYKIPGVFGGLAILFTLNIVRIISLFLIGSRYPKLFEFMHVEVWQAVFIIVAIGLWIFWIKWSRKEHPDVTE